MKKLVVFSLVAMSVVLNGCLLVPFVDSFKESGIAESDRVRLFDKQIRQYKYALMDGRSGRMLKFVDKEKFTDMRKTYRTMFNEQKIVDTKIDYVDFEDESNVAKVDLEVSYFKVPQYVVQSRIESQTWKFELGDGWKLDSIDEIGEPMAQPNSKLFRP